MPLKSDLQGGNFWTDILKDAHGQLSMARLQQAIFTFVYAIIFISQFIKAVFETYPYFEPNAYVLMGISAGTYLFGKSLRK